jgi:hypothetical protein
MFALNVRDKNSHPYTRTGKIKIVYIWTLGFQTADGKTYILQDSNLTFYHDSQTSEL